MHNARTVVHTAPLAAAFYGGWITHDVVGPFQGEPGTEGWRSTS
jgi:hypothetical protein